MKVMFQFAENITIITIKRLDKSFFICYNINIERNRSRN